MVRVRLPMQETQEMGLITGSGRSPGGGYGNPFQYSCLENPMDRGAWQATALGIHKHSGQCGEEYKHKKILRKSA